MELKAHNTYSPREALEKVAANVWMVEQSIERGHYALAGGYASTAAHFGFMLLTPGEVRRHIDGAISHDDEVRQ